MSDDIPLLAPQPSDLPPLTAEEETLGLLTVLVAMVGVLLFGALLALLIVRMIMPPRSTNSSACACV